MRRIAFVLMVGFLAVVGYAAGSAPPPAANDCRMMATQLGPDLVMSCWEGPCDLPGSVCTEAQGVVANILYRWCYCSGFETANTNCPGVAVWVPPLSWHPFCGFQPVCMEVGACARNEPYGPVQSPICFCTYVGPL